jgi:hypothetical protein
MPDQPNPPARHRKFAPAGRPPRPDHELRIELAIGPVVEPGTFRPFACRKTTPSRRSQPCAICAAAPATGDLSRQDLK